MAKTVQEKFNQAPKKLQDIVMSGNTSDILYEIEKKHEVYKEENGLRILPKETTDVLIGITHPKDFVPALVEKLEIPKERAQEIAKEVNQKIFSQVKDLLIEIHGLKKTQAITSETPSTSLENNIPTPPIVPQKSSALPQKKGFAEIKIPKKSETAPKVPIAKKDISDIRSESLPMPPKAVGKSPFTKSLPDDRQSTSETKPPVPVPQVPQKEVVSGTVPKPAVPKPPQNLHPLADHTKKEPTNLPTQKVGLKNPFEEKLRQTFTIPPKDSSSHSGSVSKKPESENTPPTLSSSETKPAFATPEPLAKAGVAESFGEAKPASAEGSSVARKKKEIKNNPYLETIE